VEESFSPEIYTVVYISGDPEQGEGITAEMYNEEELIRTVDLAAETVQSLNRAEEVGEVVEAFATEKMSLAFVTGEVSGNLAIDEPLVVGLNTLEGQMVVSFDQGTYDQIPPEALGEAIEEIGEDETILEVADKFQFVFDPEETTIVLSVLLADKVVFTDTIPEEEFSNPDFVPEFILVTAISAPLDPVRIDTVIYANATFIYSNNSATHTALWNWGDETESSGDVTEENGNGSVTGSHIYTEAGIYTITLNVTDDYSGSSDSAKFEYVVVYDPSGFVIGSGWINSPAGAYTPKPSLTGKATFNFVSLYTPGASVPIGGTAFTFRVANLNFISMRYEWLVVAGAQAKYKGVGTINGKGNYGFMLTAIDGDLKKPRTKDMFRIKIWDKNAGDKVIYDNQMGSPDDSYNATKISGGLIVICKGK
jgi:hypothetical protein